MRGLILSGGHGTRLRPLTYSQQKQLIPVANKPILFYAIEDIIEAGIKEIGIVLGPNKEQVIEAVSSINWDAEIEFIYQGEPKGLAHAILVAEEFIGDSEFVMYLGDNILRDGIIEHTKKFKTLRPDSLILLTEVANPQRFGVAELDANGKIRRLIEKPATPPSNYALVGIYFFNPIIIEACKSIKPSKRNELEITDAIQWLIENGCRIEVSFVKGWWKDTGKSEDILEANRLILDEITYDVKGIVENSEIRGRVVVEEGVVIKNSIIKGPCIIGKNTLIKSSYIGSYTSVGRDCIIDSSEIEDSVILDNTEIIGAGRITDSLIGRNVKIKKANSLPKARRFVLGDSSYVEV